MPEKYTYLLVDFFCLIFPLAFSFHPRFRFYRQWRYFALPCLTTGLFFVGWDILYNNLGIWSFNNRYIYGIRLWGLPLEEYLFFLCIPYASVFTYHCLISNFSFRADNKPVRIFSWLLMAGLAITAVTHLPQLYTSVTFLLLSALLLLLVVKRVPYLPAFYLSFALILIPFFISNGILTGSLLQRTVVSYNDHYNLGIRMWTIPVEDTFYSMLLLLMNISGMEYLQRTGYKHQSFMIADK